LHFTLKRGIISLIRLRGGEEMQVRQYDLKQIRALLNMTQPQLAKLLKVHRNTIGNLEKHPERLELAQAWILAKAAGIGIEQIKIGD
jgi:DNA-binding XRE family transcriptional regulator